MNYKNAETDSGRYVNGMYTTKNGFSGSGLNCPKGGRVYNTPEGYTRPVSFMPDASGILPGEIFVPLTGQAAKDIVEGYYLISNYGRICNAYIGTLMKMCFRPNGYGYYCLAAENCKNRQKKYTTHRLVMMTFAPCANADKLEVDHLNGDKSDNTYMVKLPDGSIHSNLQWKTHQENVISAFNIGLHYGARRLSNYEVTDIRKMYNEGYSTSAINKKYKDIGYATIQKVCNNLSYVDPSYNPNRRMNTPFDTNMAGTIKITNDDARKIRMLHFQGGFNYKQIQEQFYPHVSAGTISDICRGVTHKHDN